MKNPEKKKRNTTLPPAKAGGFGRGSVIEKKTRAQMTIETIAAISILLVLLLLVLLINFNRETLTSELNNVYIKANECNELALTISLLYSEGPFSKTEFSIEQDAEIESDYVIVGGTRCDFIGRAQSSILNKGKIIARNVSGVVVLENK